jgi:hypothetical protein
MPRSTTNPLSFASSSAYGVDEVDAYIDGLVAEMQTPAVVSAMDEAFARLAEVGGAAVNTRLPRRRA